MFVMFLWVLLAFHASLVRHGNSANVICNDAYACDSQTLDLESGSALQCFGYFSCNAATITVNSDNYVGCYGSYSCASSIMNIHAATYSFCDGLFSCKNANVYFNATTYHFYCRGEGACVGATIEIASDQRNIFCDGYRSCAEATISNKHAYYFYGGWSGQNGAFYNKASIGATTYFYFLGVYSGYGATVYCATDTTCQLYCYGTGCHDLTVICETENENDCTISKTCLDGATQSDLCPNGDTYLSTTSSSNNYAISPNISEITSQSDSSVSNDENSIDLCGNGDTLTCNAAYECSASSSLDTSNIYSTYYNNAICCSGYQACRYAINITSQIDLTAANNYDVSIRCDSRYACYKLDTTLKSVSDGGDLYFTGVFSFAIAASDTIAQIGYGLNNDQYNEIVNINNNSLNSNIYITGYGAIYYTTIKNANKVFVLSRIGIYYSNFESFKYLYCLARQACTYSNGNNIDNIIVYSYRGMHSSNVTNVNNFVFGYGYQSLYLSKFVAASDRDNVWLECHGGYCASYTTIEQFDSVTGYGSYAFQLSTIVSVKDELNVFGSYGFLSATLKNNENGFDNSNTKVNCTGYRSCYTGTFRGLSYVYGNGGDSMHSTTIYSEIYNGGTLEIDIYDDITGAWYLYCNSSDTCNVNCFSSQSCTYLYGQCDGTCKIDCNPNGGIDCAQISGNVYYPTAMPTDIPTRIPSSMPSSMPSSQPSNAPSNNPSDEPTLVPSNEPSLEPSMNPSLIPTDPPSMLPTIETTKITTSSETSTSTLAAVSTTNSEGENEDTNGNGNGNNSISESNANSDDSTTIIIIVVVVVLALLLVAVGICGIIQCQKHRMQHQIEGFCTKNSTYNPTVFHIAADVDLDKRQKICTTSPTTGAINIAISKSNHGNRYSSSIASAAIVNTFDNNNRLSSTFVAQAAQQSHRQSQIQPHRVSGAGYVSEVTPGNFVSANSNNKQIINTFDVNMDEDNNNSNNNKNNDENDSDTSDSSEAEINEIRNKVAVNTLLTQENMITPGGELGLIMLNDNTNTINIDDMDMYQENTNEDANENEIAIGANAMNNGIDEYNKNEIALEAVADARQSVKGKENFSSMLNDNLMGIEMLESDIVDEMEQDIIDPTGQNLKTPGDNHDVDAIATAGAGQEGQN